MLCNSSWEKGVRNVREASLQKPSSVPKEGRKCSRQRADSPCSPGGAHSEAGCPPADHMKQASMCNYGGAHGATDKCGLEKAATHGAPAEAGPLVELPPAENSLWCSRRTGGAAAHGAPC